MNGHKFLKKSVLQKKTKGCLKTLEKKFKLITIQSLIYLMTWYVYHLNAQFLWAYCYRIFKLLCLSINIIEQFKNLYSDFVFQSLQVKCHLNVITTMSLKVLGNRTCHYYHHQPQGQTLLRAGLKLLGRITARTKQNYGSKNSWRRQLLIKDFRHDRQKSINQPWE